MASGSVALSTANQYIKGAINWSSTPNTEGNYSDVYCELRFWRTNTGYTTYGTLYWRMNAWAGSYSSIGATTTNGATSISITYNSNTFVSSWSFRVYHNADGTANFGLGISSDTGISGTSWTSSSGSGTCYLDTIPRASNPTLSAGTTALGSAVTINTNRASSSFTHTISYGYGNIGKTTIATGVTTSTSWTLPNSLASETPSATGGTGTIYCDTYNGATLIGSKQISFSTSIPNSATFQPTIGTVTPSETVTAVSNLALGKYAQGLSNVRFTMSGIAGVYGSTVSTAKITFNGTTYNATVSGGTATWNTGVLSVSGTISYSVTVTDSRGYSDASPTTGTITVAAYSTPLISSFTAKRCDVNGNLDELGTYLKITRNGSASTLKDGSAVEKNTLACTVQWSPKGTSTWTTMAEYTVAASSTLSLTTSVAKSTKSDFAITSAYDIKFTLTDKFNNTVSTVVVAVGTVMMSWSKTGIGIGKVISSTSNFALELGDDVLLDAGRGIYSGYNNSYILKDHSNGNVTVNSAGAELFLGYATTTKVRLSQDLYDSTGTTKLLGKDGTATAYGSNANGTYVRYADGTQICWQNWAAQTVTFNSIAMGGSTYFYVGRTWTYPASFVGTPSTHNSGDIGTAAPELHGTFNPTTTACTVEDGIFGTNASTSCQNTLLAIGRWK